MIFNVLQHIRGIVAPVGPETNVANFQWDLTGEEMPVEKLTTWIQDIYNGITGLDKKGNACVCEYMCVGGGGVHRLVD